MKNPIAVVILSGLLTVVPSLAAAAADLLRLDIDDSGRYALVEVIESATGRGIEVAGAVKKRGMEFGKIDGDVDVDLLNQDGKVIASREGALSGFGSNPRNPDHSHFSVEFAPLPADARALHVRYHREPRAWRAFLTHVLTIE